MGVMDVETAFLKAPLKEAIYIEVPKGFTGQKSGQVLKHLRALYGLKQAGREWNHKAIRTFESLGYKACKL